MKMPQSQAGPSTSYRRRKGRGVGVCRCDVMVKCLFGEVFP
jgi:hypothetical protein